MLQRDKNVIIFGVSAIMVIALILLVGFGFFLSGEVGASGMAIDTTTTNASPSCSPNHGGCSIVECQMTFYNVGGGMGTATSSHVTNYTTTTNVSYTSGYSTTTTIYPSSSITGGYYWRVQACTFMNP